MFGDIGGELRRPVPLILAALAVIGWIVAIGFMISRASLETNLTGEVARVEATRADLAAQLEAQQQASGEIADLRNGITAATAEIAELNQGRDAAQAEVAAVQAELADAQRQADARRGEVATLQSDFDRLNEQLAASQTRLTEVENSITARTQEVAEVGQRLETARAQEVQTRGTVAELSEDASRLSAQVSEAEQRIQEARQSEADSETQLSNSRAELIRITEGRTSLEQLTADLAARREALAADNQAAEGRRQALQAEITTMAETLATRTEELAALERRIQDLQGEGAQLGAAAGLGLRPGRYSAGPMDVLFASDGAFRMAKTGSARAVTGRYSVQNDVLTFFDALGDTGTAQFPMACSIEPEASGFRLTDAGNSCAVFNGVSFERQG
ncbi:MAG: hypothetical protein H0T75_21185 [Rhizobiales bacterium]|nr:hypothetical protein [Hyphomicrobiales bacterium]